jgi:8-amino-7-oxononanoate synthase
MNEQFIMESAPGPETRISGRTYLYFGGTGYYGLQSHPELLEAGTKAWLSLGTNTATSRHGMGTSPVQLQVESAAAEFFGTEEACYVASGYMSNTAGVQALQATHAFDVIFIDEHAHYCGLDAARTTGMDIHIFSHMSPEDLQRSLKKHIRPGQIPLVMTDGIFPGPGHIAPLPGYLDVSEPWDGIVWVDDAHGAGVLGPNGRGTAEHFGVNGDRVFSGTTLSKAFGGFGGLVSGSADFMQSVRTGPTLAAASAPPSPIAAATAKGIELLAANPEWRETLRKNAVRLSAGLRALGIDVGSSELPIATFSMGSDAENRRVFEKLLERGIAIQFTSYPGTGSSDILRMVVFSTHSEEQIDYFLSELAALI